MTAAASSGDARPPETPRVSSGVAWIDARIHQMRDARDFLTRLGLEPRHAIGSQGASGWRVPRWSGVFSDAELLQFARERGFVWRGVGQ